MQGWCEGGGRWGEWGGGGEANIAQQNGSCDMMFWYNSSFSSLLCVFRSAIWDILFM